MPDNEEINQSNQAKITPDDQNDNNIDSDASKYNYGKQQSSYIGIFRNAFILLSSLAMVFIVRFILLEHLPKESFLPRLFGIGIGESETTSLFILIVPIAILYLFLWVLVDLILKWWSVLTCKREQKDAIYNHVATHISRGEWNKAITLSQSVGRSRLSILLTNLVKLLSTTRKSQTAHEILRHQIDIENEALSSRYAMIHTFIWAMPILGFIGTVLGIGDSIGGFSGFLSSDVNTEEIEIIKSQLSLVVKGLSYAFDTTLFGLVSSLISMIIVSIVEKYDKYSIAKCEDIGLSLLTASQHSNGAMGIESTNSEEVKPLLIEFTKSSNQLIKLLVASLQVITKAFKDIETSLIPELKQTTTSIQSTSTIKEGFEGLRNQLSVTSKSLQNTNTTLELLVSNIKQMAHSIPSAVSIKENFENLREQIGTASTSLQDVKTAITEMTTIEVEKRDVVEGKVTEIHQWAQEQLGRVDALLVGLSKKIEALSEIGTILPVTEIKELVSLSRQMHKTQNEIRGQLGKFDGKLELRLFPNLSISEDQ